MDRGQGLTVQASEGPWPYLAPDHSLNLAISVLFRYASSLVVQLLALGQSQLHLSSVVFDVQPQRYKGQAFLLHLTGKTAYLVSMQQKLSRPSGLVVVPVASRVLGYVGVEEPQLPIFGSAEGVTDIDLSGANGLDLGASQDQTSLDSFQDVVIEAGLSINGYGLHTGGRLGTDSWAGLGLGGDQPFQESDGLFELGISLRGSICLGDQYFDIRLDPLAFDDAS